MTTRLPRPAVLTLLPAAILLLIAIAFAAAEPAAATRYLSPAGGDAGGASLCLDPAAPCATLRHAVAVSQPGDTLHFAPGSYPAGGITLPHALTLRGDDAAGAALDGGSAGTVLIVAPGVTAAVEGLAIRGGAGLRGGGIRVEAGGVLAVRRADLSGNRADLGGAIYAANGSVTVEDSHLTGNTAGTGGAIYLDGGSLVLARSDVSGNRAGAGAGLFAGATATAALNRVTLTGNVANTVGGAVHNAGTLTVANAVLRDNRAGARGGGLFNDHGATDIDYSTFLDNSAPRGGSIAGAGAGGSGVVRLRTSVLTGRDLCDGPVDGSGNLAAGAGCGQPAQPATGLLAGGRPESGSNAIDAGPIGSCATAGGAPPADLRGEPRPADGDRDGSARCDIGAYEFQPRLTVIHNPALVDGSRFDFSGDFGPFALSASDRPRRVLEAAPGAYRLEQSVKPGWKLNALTCSGDSDGGTVVDLPARAATVDIDPGEAITCVFSTRPNRDTVGVAVRAPAGTDPVVAISGDLGTFDLRPATQPDRRSGRLAAGTYAVRAAAPAGWRVSAVACAGDSDGGTTTDAAAATALVDLDAKEAIGCVFTLAPSGAASLTIRHATAGATGPAADAPAVYTGGLGVFALRAVSAGSRVFAPPPGTYRVHELLHPQSKLGLLECIGDGDGGTVLLPEEATAVIDLDAGEAITCTFSHVRASSGTGAITIVEAATPADGTSFPFAGALGDFALAPPGAGSRVFAGLRPGTYQVRQVTPAGWALDGVACAGDDDSGTTLLPDEAAALIDLDEGEAITCTYSSSRPASTAAVTIIHEAYPADETLFRYNGALGGFSLRVPSRPSRAFVGLAPGAYTVGFRAVDGWTLGEIACEGDTDGGSRIDTAARNVTLDLDAGEAIVCRYRHLGPGATPPPTPTPSPTPPPPTPTPPPSGAGERVYVPFVKR